VFAVIAEALWIGGAAALGTGSHFNESTPLVGPAKHRKSLF
jgi:hypothetical protein